ncbi:MAG: hypothetical protein FWC98_01265 [Bacteroidales bacterium]|nr:hypothetical protein [Bacteroidales bacterium]
MPSDWAIMQDIVAKELDMIRGERGAEQGLNHWEFKVEKRKEELTELDIQHERKIAVRGKEIQDREDRLGNEVQNFFDKNADVIEFIECLKEAPGFKDIPNEIIDDNNKPHRVSFLDRFKAWCGIEIEAKNISCSAIYVEHPNKPIVKAFYLCVWFMWDKQMKKWLTPTTKPTLSEEATNKRLQQGVKPIEKKRKGLKM